jgi:hypothetical protein
MAEGVEEPAVKRLRVPLDHIARQLDKSPQADYHQEGNHEHPEHLVPGDVA